MLLHMIGASGRVDSAMDWTSYDGVLNHVKNGPGGFVFDAINQGDIIDGAQIVRLTARRRIERRFVENHAKPAIHAASLESRRVKFRQVGIVVIESRCLHSNSPLPAAAERGARKAVV